MFYIKHKFQKSGKPLPNKDHRRKKGTHYVLNSCESIIGEYKIDINCPQVAQYLCGISITCKHGETFPGHKKGKIR